MTRSIMVLKKNIMSGPLITGAVIVGIILSLKWYIFSQVNKIPPYQIADTVLIEKIDLSSQYVDSDRKRIESGLIIYVDGRFELFPDYNYKQLIRAGSLTVEQLAIIKDIIDNKKYTRRTEMFISRYASGWGEAATNNIGVHFLIREGNKTIEIENSRSGYDPVDPMMEVLYSIEYHYKYE